MGPGMAGGPTAAAVVAASEGKAKKYGLLGLLGVIRMTDPDLNMLALGSDLTTMGLNLDSSEVSFSTRAAEKRRVAGLDTLKNYGAEVDHRSFCGYESRPEKRWMGANDIT